LHPEYWYFALFDAILSGIARVLDLALLKFPPLHPLFLLASIAPHLAAKVRRLHDTDHSGWRYLLAARPIIGTIIVTIWLATEDAN
jgi:uncharacterized membrane protein YhaH (DUF805 family)